MPSTHTSLHYHLIFATHDRENRLAPAWRDRLFAYLGGAVRAADGVAEIVGGVADHVHLLLSLKPTHRIADVVRDIKRSSSTWIRQSFDFNADFRWQEGYGAFTVSASACDAVRDYISRQEAHHQHRSFRDELVDLLEKSGVGFDPRFLD